MGKSPMRALGDAVRQHRTLVFIVLGAAALRGLYLVELAQRPDLCFPGADAGYHAAWARALVSGDFGDPRIATLGSTPYLRPPGYAFALAAVYAAFGESCIAPRIAQACLGLLNVLLAFALGARIFDRSVGYVSALLVGFYWGFVYFEGELLAPVWLTTLSLLWLHTVLPWARTLGPASGAAAGALLGLGALVRPNMLVCALPTLAWALWRARKAGGLRSALPGLLAFGFALTACVGAATARNRAASAQWVPISANAGINLRIGNHPGATGLFVGELPELGPFGTMEEYPRVVARVSEQEGRALTEAEVSGVLARRSLTYALEHPATELLLLGRKVGHLLGRTEHGHNRVIAMDREHSVALGVLPGDFGAVVGLCVAGMALVWWRRGALMPVQPQRREACGLMAGFMLCYGASFLPFFITGQYRIPLVAPMLVFGAAALVAGARLWRRRERRAAATLTILAAASYGLSTAVAQPLDRAQASATWHYDRGLAFQYGGRTDEAAADYRAALAEAPAATMAGLNLALLYERAGESREAERLLRDVLRHGAPRLGEVRAALGTNLARQGRLDEAEVELRAALTEREDLPTAQANLASILLSRGMGREASVHARAALKWNPQSRLAQQVLTAAQRTGAATR